jgi:post-segregation antitoxin (ccd killing protein)
MSDFMIVKNKKNKKTRVNLYLEKKIVEKAKKKNINLSKTLENTLKRGFKCS